ncbi:unnamed protein product, partial [marine sediment metagenome]
MPKLSTPVQYEPALEGLNDIRPLQLADESKVVVPYPVLCKNPPSKDRPAVGMFARCSQQGALLKSNNIATTDIDRTTEDFSEAAPLVHYPFTQKVSGVIAKYVNFYGTSGLWWCNSNGTIKYTALSTAAYVFLPFVGKD